MEQRLLRTLNYELEVRHPHTYLLHIVRELEGSDEVANLAFCILNDSLCTTLCLQFPPHTIAVSALFLALELLTATGGSASAAASATDVKTNSNKRAGINAQYAHLSGGLRPLYCVESLWCCV